MGKRGEEKMSGPGREEVSLRREVSQLGRGGPDESQSERGLVGIAGNRRRDVSH